MRAAVNISTRNYLVRQPILKTRYSLLINLSPVLAKVQKSLLRDKYAMTLRLCLMSWETVDVRRSSRGSDRRDHVECS